MKLIYLTCALTALACAALLLSGYARTRQGLLLWSGLCFAALTVNNALVFVDLVVLPGAQLVLFRDLAAVTAVALLLWGLVWEAR